MAADAGDTTSVESEVTEFVGPVFHYTTPTGLLNILERKELWATEAAGMNDVAEVRQGWAFIRDWMTDQDPTDDVIKDLKFVAGLDQLSPYDHPARSTDGVFMCCASTRPDDANQWRLYANAARGYCIELDGRIRLSAVSDGRRPKPLPDQSALPPAKRRIRIPDGVAMSPWLRVLYTHEEKTLALRRLVTRITAERLKLVEHATAEGWPEDDYRVEADMMRDTHSGDLARLAQLMKSAGFEGEHEVRLIAWSWWRAPAFRATPHGVVGYIRLTQSINQRDPNEVVYLKDPGLVNGKTLPIRSVRLGPLLHVQNNRGTIEALLGANALAAVPVIESEVPLGN